MNRTVMCLWILLLLATGSSTAKVVEASACAIVADPTAYDGKIVRVRGRITVAMEVFSLTTECPNGAEPAAIWLEYGYPEPSPTPYCCPGGWDENNKPIFSSPRVVLVRDRNFRQLKRLLARRRDGRDNDGEKCSRYQPAPLECQKYEVTATLTGRLFGVSMPVGRAGIGAGFGHFGMYSAKLVIRRVELVSAQERALPASAPSQQAGK